MYCNSPEARATRNAYRGPKESHTPLETPIDDPVKTKHETNCGYSYYDTVIKERGVDTAE